MPRTPLSRRHAPILFILMVSALAFAAVSLMFVTRAEDKSAAPKSEPILSQEAKVIEDALSRIESELNSHVSRAEANSPADNDSASALDYSLAELRRRLIDLKSRVGSLRLDPTAALGLRNRISIIEERINRREAQKRRATRPAAPVTKGAEKGGRLGPAATGAISGNVTDSVSSLFIENVNIEIYNSTGAFITSATTDAFGNYTSAAVLATGNYFLRTTNNQGYINEVYNNITCVVCNPTSGTPVAVTDGATTSGIDFLLAKGGRISGGVTNASSSAFLVGVNVQIHDSGGAIVANGFTDGTGNYISDAGLPAGSYFARTNNNQGFIDKLYNNTTCAPCNVTAGTPITVTGTATTTGINFALNAGGRISGNVTDASSAAALAGVSVDIFNSTGAFVTSGFTDGTGNYITPNGLLPGSYFARTNNSSGYVNKLYNNITCLTCNVTSGTPISVTAGSTTSGISFALNLGGRISGAVTDAATSAPLVNVDVQIFNSSGAFVTSGFTDNLGNYTSASGLLPGNHFVRTNNQVGYIDEVYNNITCLSCNPTSGTPVSVTAGMTTSGISFGLVAGGRISGTVTSSATSAPISNLNVEIFDASGFGVSGGFTDGAGNYISSKGLTPGTYYARTRNALGFIDEVYNNINCLNCNPTSGTAITVTAGMTTSGINFALATGGRVSGNVTDASTAAPLSSINVNIFDATGLFVSSGFTDGLGNYITDGGLPSGTYFALTNNSSGYVNKLYNNITCLTCNVTSGTPISVTAGSTTSGISFSLNAGGRISGTVTDASTAAPLANVNVQILNSAGVFVSGGFTDNAGQYLSAAGLTTGNYFVLTQNSQGYVNEVYNNIACAPCNPTTGTPVSVTAGSTTSGISFALVAGGRISGTVTNSSTLVPLGNVNVQVFNSTGAFVASGFTDGSGNYVTAEGLVAGTYFAQVNNTPGFISELYNNITCLNCNPTSGTPITVTAGATTSGINFALAPGGSISGQVTDGATSAGIAGATVSIFDAAGFQVAFGATDGAGNYNTNGGLPSGAYFARTNNSSNYIDELYNNITCLNCNVTTGTPITVTAGSTTSGINFGLNVGGRISGTITDSATSLPIANASVEIFDSAGVFVATGFADSSGNYITNGGLPAGNYFARTRNQSGYIEKLYNNITCLTCNVTTGTPITVTAGSTTSGINFALVLGGRISGTITDAVTSAPLMNTGVQIFNSAGVQVGNGFTDNAGNYTTSGGLPAGNYFARTNSNSGYLNKLYNNIDCSLSCDPITGTAITVTAGSTTSGINFALMAGGRISGTVTDATTSAPIANINVDIFSSTGAFITSGFTDGAGNYIANGGLPTGSYFARTNNSSGYVNKLYNNITCAPCNVTAGTPISVTAGSTTTSINFALNLGGRISGTVTDAATSAPIANVNVQLFNSTGSFIESGFTNASGNYISNSGLPAGNYFARTNNSSGYIDELYNNISCFPNCTVTSGTPISVTAGSTTSGINFGLNAGGRISGTVTDSATSAPLVNVNVQIHNSSGVFLFSFSTDSAGNYITGTGLPAGNYFARTTNTQGYIDEVYNNITCAPCSVTSGTPITVTAGSTTSSINFALAPGGRISGTVTDATTSAPIANVNVQVFNSSGASVTGVNTNASGIYTIQTGLPAGNYFLRTNNSLGYINELYDNINCATGCTVTTGTPVAVTAGATTTGINFALVQGGVISGTVTDSTTSAPIANVNVQIFNSSGGGIGSVNSDGSGNYSFGGLTSGTYFARTNNSLGYINEVYNNITCVVNCDVTAGTPITVTAGTTTSGINFALAPGGRISGTVTDSATSAPLSGISVQVFDSAGFLVNSVNTDGSGNYLINIGLVPGNYFARTNNQVGYINELYNNITCAPCNVISGTPISVTAGATTSGINFALAQGGRISGTVTDAATSAPIANMQIQIRNTSGAVVVNAGTNGSGSYTTGPGLPPGTYYARTNSQQGYINEIYNNTDCMTCNQTSGTPIAVTAGATTPGINFSLTLGGRISGTVTDAVTGDPLPDIFVEVYNAAGQFVFATVTDPSGNYLSGGAGLLAGNYFVRTSSESGYINELYNNTNCAGCSVTTGTPVAVTLGATTPNINFTLSQGGLVSGTVTDAATSAPVVNAQVEIYNSCGQFVTSVPTDASGNYLIPDGLPTGTYFAATFGTLDHQLQVYNNTTCVSCILDPTSGTPISVTAGMTTTGINFALERGGTITGVVTDAATGGGLAGVTVNIFDSAGAFVSQGNTNIEGRFISLLALPTGTYFALTANGHGYINEAYNDIACLGCTATMGTPISVTAGATTSGIDFAMSAAGRLSGKITNASTSAPVINAGVQVYNSSGTLITTVATDSSGNYISRGGLPAGTYFVRTSNSQGLIDEVFNNVECAGCNVTTGTPVVVTAGSTTMGIDFALGAGGRISGTVTNAVTTGPVVLTPVQIYNATGGLAAFGFTDCAGNYISGAGLPTGTYYARTANTKGFGDVLYNNIACANCDPVTGSPISVTTGLTTSSINFALCSFSLSASSKHFPATGGEGTITLTSAGTCAWAAASNAAWIEITSNPGGSGGGSLSYLVRDNLGAAPRTGTITVAGRTFTVTQDGQSPAGCTFTISPLFASYGPTGGAGSISLTTAAGCAWKSESNRSWITITSACCGIGNGTVTYAVAPNMTGSGRSGVITIGGQKFNIKQK
ncbi:MAG TPA: carboxypeptidase regulatory-like domain-containing protein [Blastocatellia bacterium]|nr:carboxypeptidase regulatory-like domain-containing protein [Blastocatellia bacterium]